LWDTLCGKIDKRLYNHLFSANFFSEKSTCGSRRSAKTRPATVLRMVLSPVEEQVDLRLPQVDKKIKNLSPLFGRDLVARGSSGLKPLRRRAPRVSPLPVHGIRCGGSGGAGETGGQLTFWALLNFWPGRTTEKT